ncbi:MAG TPA: CoB--CoM heterodisulfide reductase iron-sulfur subunit A family protein [Bacteroidia bacterium]|nr:CoB--CoM heterodisulfide reductase iron-sulfur subunit A family protein [Bacteroidia bacterium]HRS60018.1 CoB--CoM heterodisulfide reductase iron-sulfur subunit A family protein [Bacteroidia bacterium]HRU69305.1 CoB--CoM heterodisulfide reductase iron-sulfur subunit A family protein [Bacteroidia bacterium]
MNDIRIGVYVCWCGTNIAKMVDVEKISEELATLPNVVIAKNYKYMCSDPGQDLIIQDIKEHKLNRVVVAACSPRIHELTFRKALEHAGLNPYMFEMANIREQVSWVHTDRTEATKKAKSLVAAAINRVNYHEALDKRKVEIDPSTLVIGGGISGMTAALELAGAGKDVFLIEKSKELGGYAARLDLTFPYFYSASQMIRPVINKVLHHEHIKVFTEAEIEEIFGYIGSYQAKIRQNGSSIELKFGNIIVATGLKPFNPSVINEYGYGRLPDVITSLEFEEMLKSGRILTKEGKIPGSVAIIHCVGSRNKNYHDYCSRTCCNTALKYANQIKSALPETHVYQLYADMRAFGKGCEELYAKTSRKNVIFMMFDQRGKLPEVRKAGENDGCNLLINFHELLSSSDVEVPVDLVVLMTAMEAHENARDIARAAGISMCGNEFYIEKHPKLDPVATTTDGVYIVGTCQSPKDIPDSVSQAKAAAARILATISKGEVEVEVTTAAVNEDICCGCQTCVKVCPYSAISYIEERNVSHVNEILCKGCGTCGSACPSGAIRCRHFTDRQILSQIEGLMEMILLEEEN